MFQSILQFKQMKYLLYMQKELNEIGGGAWNDIIPAELEIELGAAIS